MSFKIPTLEEARRKQERSISLIQGQQQRSAVPRRPTTSRETSKLSSGPGVNGSQGKRRAASSSIVNPYAKKKKVAPPTACTGVASNSIAQRPGEPPAASKQSIARKSAPPLDPGPFASFSQAFGSVEDTVHYEKEVAALRHIDDSGGTSSVADSQNLQRRAEQRAFDAAAAAEAENDDTDDTATSASSSSHTARDNHLLLQPHVLHVSTRQRGNGLLRFIRNVPYAHSNMVPDYIMGPNRCALFLSCKYHGLHPNYIHRRIAELGNDFDLRVLLCLVDVQDNASTLLFLNKLSVVNNLTLILAWSEEEAARYLETYKAYEGKDASSIQKREQTTFPDQMADVLCTVRSVNKTDSAQLLSQFGSLRALMKASMDELSLCPGIGEKKVRRLFDAFHKPFSSAAAKKRHQEGGDEPPVTGDHGSTASGANGARQDGEANEATAGVKSHKAMPSA